MRVALASLLCLQLNLGVKPPRSWHIACTHYPSMGQSEVLLFGGNVHVKPGEKERVETADLRILSWGGWMHWHLLQVFLHKLLYSRTSLNQAPWDWAVPVAQK